MKIVFLALFVLSSLASARTLFVSDIDDTVKISHVLNTASALKNAIRVDNHFNGMSQAYQVYHQFDPQAEIVYLTNAPQIFMGSFHARFLQHNHFPQGLLLLRQSLSDQNFKLTQLRQLIQREHPTRLVLIGDNGEKDVQVYAQIQAEYPQIPTFVYIHQIYSSWSHSETGSLLDRNQKGFVTGLDLMTYFLSERFITSDIYQKYIKSVVPQMLKEDDREDDGNIAFPSWIDCRDFFGARQSVQQRPYQPPQNVSSLTESQLYSEYKMKLKNRCLTGPLE